MRLSGTAARADDLPADPTRVVQGVVTGIGFLGAGVIMRDGLSISGLTTAASIWAASAIGVLLGVGFYAAALLLALLCMASMSLLHRLEAKLPGRSTLEVCVTFGVAGPPPFDELVERAEARGYRVLRDSLRITFSERQPVWRFCVVALDRARAASPGAARAGNGRVRRRGQLQHRAGPKLRSVASHRNHTGNVSMAHVFIFGATGSLGRCVLRQAVESGHDVTVFVRDPSKLAPELSTRIGVRRGDLLQSTPDAIADLVRGHDAVLNCAGHVTDGQGFVDLVGRLVDGVERLQVLERPACWFLAGAALLDIGESGRRGVDLPKVKNTYWPHRANFERLQRSTLAWSLLCPGPMVDQAPVGLGALRVSIDRLPVPIRACVPIAARSAAAAHLRIQDSGNDHPVR